MLPGGASVLLRATIVRRNISIFVHRSETTFQVCAAGNDTKIDVTCVTGGYSVCRSMYSSMWVAMRSAAMVPSDLGLLNIAIRSIEKFWRVVLGIFSSGGASVEMGIYELSIFHWPWIRVSAFGFGSRSLWNPVCPFLSSVPSLPSSVHQLFRVTVHYFVTTMGRWPLLAVYKMMARASIICKVSIRNCQETAFWPRYSALSSDLGAP